MTTWLRDAAAWRAGLRVLDVACGPGYPALAAARAVAPSGLVVAIDLSSQMIDAAAERARAGGVENIEFAQQDAEELQFPSQSFDVVMNVYGLMFCPEPPRALAEAHRVLAPDGRIAIVTWDLPSHNPFFSVIREVAAGFFELREPGPDEPHPFRLASADGIRSMLEDAGFGLIQVETMTMVFEFDSVHDYCRIFSDFAWRSRLDALSSDENARLVESVTEATRDFMDDGRLRLATSSVCASATAQPPRSG